MASYAATAAISPDQSTDALFRVWGAAVSAKFALMGLVQTADTGQINWTTVTHPTVSHTSMGYEIWRFADTLQATVPVYIKIEYGGGAVAGAPGVWMTVGSGTNGAGTITGQVGTRIESSSQASGTGIAAKNCVFSGNTNRLGMALFTDYASGALAWFIERTKNSDGTDSSLGVLLYTEGCSSGGGAGNRVMQYVPASGAVPASVVNSHMAAPFGATTGAFGSDIAIYPNLIGLGGSFLNACITHFGYFNADITRDVTFTATFYGATHTYYPLGNTSGVNLSFRDNVPTGGSIAMLYE